jgi:hypothetical protein
MFRSLSYDHPRGSSFVLSALPLLRLFASSFALFGVWLYVYVSVCPVYLSVGCLQTTHRQVHPEDGHMIMTETCRVFNYVFTEHF